MSNTDFADAMQGFSHDFFDTAAATTDVYLSLLSRVCQTLTPGGAEGSAGGQSRRTRLRAEIWNMRRLLRIAMGGGMDRDLAAVFETLARNRDEVQQAVVVWVDAIEVLIQTEEKRYGSRPGLGPTKAAEVKAVVWHLLRNHEFDLPLIPSYLEPLVMQMLVDWVVDAVVRVLNRYGMWEEAEPEAGKLRTWAARLWLKLKDLFRPLFEAVARVAQRLWESAHPRPELSPQMREALDALEREGLITRCHEVVSWATGAIIWITKHKKQLTALVELIFAAVQEAESYFELSGPEKKAYATDLVLAVLDEMGFKTRMGLMFAIIDSTISTGIETAVHLFNKRGVFQQ